MNDPSLIYMLPVIIFSKCNWNCSAYMQAFQELHLLPKGMFTYIKQITWSKFFLIIFILTELTNLIGGKAFGIYQVQYLLDTETHY